MIVPTIANFLDQPGLSPRRSEGIKRRFLNSIYFGADPTSVKQGGSVNVFDGLFYRGGVETLSYFFENTMRPPNFRPTPFEKLPN